MYTQNNYQKSGKLYVSNLAKNIFVPYREAEMIKHVQQLEEQLQQMIQNRKEDVIQVKISHGCKKLTSVYNFKIFKARLHICNTFQFSGTTIR